MSPPRPIIMVGQLKKMNNNPFINLLHFQITSAFLGALTYVDFLQAQYYFLGESIEFECCISKKF
jgi:hypothetical protein